MGWATRSSARAAKLASALKTLYVIHSNSEPVRAAKAGAPCRFCPLTHIRCHCARSHRQAPRATSIFG